MNLRLVNRSEILSILKISGNLGKAFSAVKLDVKCLDFAFTVLIILYSFLGLNFRIVKITQIIFMYNL